MIGPAFPPSPKEGAWLAVCVGVLGSASDQVLDVMNYRFAYSIGFHPWEDAASDLPWCTTPLRAESLP